MPERPDNRFFSTNPNFLNTGYRSKVQWKGFLCSARPLNHVPHLPTNVAGWRQDLQARPHRRPLGGDIFTLAGSGFPRAASVVRQAGHDQFGFVAALLDLVEQV